MFAGAKTLPKISHLQRVLPRQTIDALFKIWRRISPNSGYNILCIHQYCASCICEINVYNSPILARVTPVHQIVTHHSIDQFRSCWQTQFYFPRNFCHGPTVLSGQSLHHHPDLKRNSQWFERAIHLPNHAFECASQDQNFFGVSGLGLHVLSCGVDSQLVASL